MNAEISAFIYFLIYILHDCAFKATVPLNKKSIDLHLEVFTVICRLFIDICY